MENTMKTKLTVLAVACTISIGLTSQIHAASYKTGGTVCWTGDIEYLATTKKDMGWAWSLNFTYLSDSDDPAKNSSGRCLGSGGMVDGTPEASPFFCQVNFKDGAKHMVRGVGGAKSVEEIYYGGSGRLAGIAGTAAGDARIDLPAESGKIAGCRNVKGEFTLPE
jgi:hypothetical protein